jgi:methylated-DNA-[protein]-cysteine S-methyltransferase
MDRLAYVSTPTNWGNLAVVWQDGAHGPQVSRVLLPEGQTPVEEMLHAQQNEAEPGTCAAIDELLEQIAGCFLGLAITFPLPILALDTCPPFQQRVLRAEHAIPRGWVSTYGRIAAHLGSPGAARAVGNALARNPFPILIPCHRAIRSGGGLGGFRGGLAMKRALLEMEGVKVSPQGKVLTDRLYY